MLSTALVLAAGELVVRQWVISPSVAVPDAHYQWAYLPHARIVHSTEGWCSTHTNSMGLLDDELRVPRARVRALLLGDSYAEALQVARQDNLDHVAERRVPGLEVVNAGVSGRLPLDYADWLEEFGPRLAPDIVIVQVNDGDLVGLTQPANLVRLARPHPVGAPTVTPPESWPARLLRRVLHSSALVTAVWHRAKLLATDRHSHPTRPFHLARPSTTRTDPFANPRLPAVLDSLHRRLAAHAPRLIYLYVPVVDYFGPQVAYSDARAAAVWHAFANRNQAKLLDVFEPFRAEFERTGQPLHGFSNSVLGTGHLNAAGHRVVGEQLARAIAEAMR